MGSQLGRVSAFPSLNHWGWVHSHDILVSQKSSFLSLILIVSRDHPHHLCHLFSFRSSHFIIIIIIIIGVVIIIVRYWHSSPSCLSLIIITIICVDFILPFKLLYSLSFKFLVIQVTTGWFSSHHSSCVYSHHESCFCPLSFVDFNSDISPDILWGNLTWQ